MKPSPFSSILIKFSTLILVVSILTACGSPAEDSPSEGVPQEETSVESSTEDSQTETNTTGGEFDDQELPTNFPEVFPLPEYAKIGSTGAINHFAFYTDSIADVKTKLTAAGYPITKEILTPINGNLLLFTEGPNGERIEFMEAIHG